MNPKRAPKRAILSSFIFDFGARDLCERIWNFDQSAGGNALHYAVFARRKVPKIWTVFRQRDSDLEVRSPFNSRNPKSLAASRPEIRHSSINFAMHLDCPGTLVFSEAPDLTSQVAMQSDLRSA
jgi:hypothetical protein